MSFRLHRGGGVDIAKTEHVYCEPGSLMVLMTLDEARTFAAGPLGEVGRRAYAADVDGVDYSEVRFGVVVPGTIGNCQRRS
jgi:hypothetical protein